MTTIIPTAGAPAHLPTDRSTRLGALAVAGGALAVFLPWLGARDLWAPDEPRFAAIGREMLRSGDWILPRMNGEPIALLPPLTYWLVALFGLLGGGVGETTARLGLVLSGTLALLGVYRLGSLMGGTRRAGIASAAVLASTAMFCHQVRFLQADIHLLAGATWALVFFHDGHAHGDRRTRYPLMGIAIAWAILAKGPIGFVAPGLVVLAFLLVERELGSGLLRRPSFWAAVSLCALLVLPWYLAACVRGGDAFARELLLKHNFGMFFDTWSHERPVWYYLVRLPEFFLPWTLLLPAGVLHVLRRRRGDAGARRDARLLLAWAVVLFAFFSISDAKQAKYLLPLYPALAVMVGLLWAELPEAEAHLPRPRLLVRAPIATAGGLLALAGIGAVGAGIAVLAGAVALDGEAAEVAAAIAPATIAIGALLLPAGAATIVLGIRGRHPAALALLAGAVLLGSVVLQAGGWPALDPQKSARTLCAELDRHAPPGAPLGVLFIGTTQHGGFIFYGERPTVPFGPEGGGGDPLEEMWAHLGRAERAFVVTKESAFEQLAALPPEQRRAPIHELFRVRKGSKRLVVFSNRPAPGG